MNYDMPGQGTQARMPAQNRVPVNTILYAICRRHDKAIESFCMVHNKALCPECVPEHESMVQYGNVGNAPSEQMRHSGNSAVHCQLKYPDQAIKESITRMHVCLRSVQEFIKKKDSIEPIQNPSMYQIYMEQNHIFETSYNVAHDLLTRIQSMKPSEKLIQLEPFNKQFTEKFNQLQNTS